MNLHTNNFFKILADNLPDEVSVKYSLMQKKKEYTSLAESLTKLTWERLLSESPAKLFDGRVYSLIDYRFCEDIIDLRLQETSYRYFCGTNLLNSGILRHSEMANTLAACFVVETTNNKIILGLRSNQVAENSGYWHVPGGNIDDLSENNDISAIVENELLEELGISPEQIDLKTCLALAENSLINKPELIFYIKLKIDELEVLFLQKKAINNSEHDVIKFIDKEEITDFINSNLVAPIGLAALHCFLQSKFCRF